MDEYIVVFITTSGRDEAERLAMGLINAGHAPCINIVAPCSSIYQWKGAVHRSEEALMIVKSERSRYPALREFVERVHSYDVPEILGIPISCIPDGYASFLSGFFRTDLI